MTYWALKTWESDNKGYSKDKDKWKYFLKDQVIAIGWKNLDISLNNKTKKEEIREALIVKALKEKYPYSDRIALPAALNIFKFIHIEKEDHVLLCGGYNQHTKVVRLYGTAENILDFRIDSNPRWKWEQKHNAKVIGFLENKRDISRDILEKMLGLRSLMPTLQEISEKGYKSVVEWARP
jgi:hypothetical protein